MILTKATLRTYKQLVCRRSFTTKSLYKASTTSDFFQFIFCLQWKILFAPISKCFRENRKMQQTNASHAKRTVQSRVSINQALLLTFPFLNFTAIRESRVLQSALNLRWEKKQWMKSYITGVKCKKVPEVYL